MEAEEDALTPGELSWLEPQGAPQLAGQPARGGAAPGAQPPDCAHGNPSVALPPNHAGGRIEILGGARNQPLWRSHGLPPGAAYVSVNVWDGSFVGGAAGWALLEDGGYEVRWHDGRSVGASLGRIEVRAWRVFSHAFAGMSQPRDLSAAGWQVRGRWACSPEGMWAGPGPARVFKTAAMHGVVEAAFRLAGPVAGGAAWGLLARHYNHLNHMRVFVRPEGACWRVGLARYPAPSGSEGDHAVVAQTLVEAPPASGARLAWVLNGATHRVYLNDAIVLEACDGYMGGVEIAGLFADTDAVVWTRAQMTTTQRVPVFRVEHPAYAAVIRPGNVASLFLRQSAAPDQDICWESGVQFGHIGGSEIKFTQGARLSLLDKGGVLATVAWSGPMPKFVEQSADVRGWAHGKARFYEDAIVVDDRVLAWVNRSVGPDLDLLSTLVDGPARVCDGGQDEFLDWRPDAGGLLASPAFPDEPPRFPIALAIPLRLGREGWWLSLLSILRHPAPEVSPVRLFAWHCGHGLTASYDLRVSPTEPGREYAYTHVVRWLRAETPRDVERVLLSLRHAWLRPLRIEAVEGEAVAFDAGGEQPREAMDFNGSFDVSSGQYVFRAREGRFAFHADPLDAPRAGLVFAVRGWPQDRALTCRLDGRVLSPGLDYTAQTASSGELLLRLKQPLDRPALIEGAAG